jgi:hypothetical protein
MGVSNQMKYLSALSIHALRSQRRGINVVPGDSLIKTFGSITVTDVLRETFSDARVFAALLAGTEGGICDGSEIATFWSLAHVGSAIRKQTGGRSADDIPRNEPSRLTRQMPNRIMLREWRTTSY